VLEAKYKLGLFDDPYRYVSEERNKQQIMSGDKLQLSKEAAIKSFVLLKNDNVLPLSGEKKVAFIGPLVKDQRNLIGSWSGAGDWKKAISVWDAVSKRTTAAPISYAKGCNITDDSGLIKKLNPHDAQIVLDTKSPKQLIDEAVEVAKAADVIVAVLGEAFGMTGEAVLVLPLTVLTLEEGLQGGVGGQQRAPFISVGGRQLATVRPDVAGEIVVLPNLHRLISFGVAGQQRR